ncbi:MAG: hypothetical protein AAGD25_26485 [Cyanobacteria bacterium P01_F01_bin.150]
MNVLSPFDETVRDLTLAQHLPRIKKLLVYACTHHWESNAVGLASYHLHDLVKQLVQIAPTFSALKIHLNGVIQTLNKSAEYTLVANTLMRHLQPLYPDAVSYSSEHYQSLYFIAAQHLEQDSDAKRIKKLIHFVCRDQWGHDTDTVELHTLIEELHSLTPTSDELTAVLESVVQTISKPDKYRAIAQRIIQGLAPLYYPTTHALMHPEQAVSEISEALSEHSAQPQSSAQLKVCLSETQPRDGVATPKANSSSAPLVHSATGNSTPPADTKSQRKLPEPMSMRKKVASLPPEDLFELRNEIHKFTNPLLAKYLLFMNSYASAVQETRDSKPGQWNIMVWDALKSTDIDTLLCDGLKHCRNLGEFERSLKRTARQFSRPKQYSGVISAIVRAVTPMFADCQEPPAIVYPAVQEEVQGTPTYGKRRSSDGPPSEPIYQDISEQPSAYFDSPSSFDPERLKRQNNRPQSFSEQETAFEVPALDPAAPGKFKVSEVNHVSLASDSTAALETAALDASVKPPGLDSTASKSVDLEPTESDSYLDNTENEPPSQSSPLFLQANSENVKDDRANEKIEQAINGPESRLGQQLNQPLKANSSEEFHGGSSEETAYLVPPLSSSAALSQEETAYLVSTPPYPTTTSKVASRSQSFNSNVNQKSKNGKHPLRQEPVDETLFLPAP